MHSSSALKLEIFLYSIFVLMIVPRSETDYPIEDTITIMLVGTNFFRNYSHPNECYLYDAYTNFYNIRPLGIIKWMNIGDCYIGEMPKSAETKCLHFGKKEILFVQCHAIDIDLCWNVYTLFATVLVHSNRVRSKSSYIFFAKKITSVVH